MWPVEWHTCTEPPKRDKPTQDEIKSGDIVWWLHQAFAILICFRNPILFEIWISTISKLCKNV
jgi:hypothetical protein